MANEITDSVNSAIARLQFDAHQLPEAVAAEIEAHGMSRFVLGSPRAWWMALKMPALRFSSKDRPLSSCIPTKVDRCWLIAETEEANLPVFDVWVKDLESILAECPFFEYYVLARDYSWFAAESDHNVIYLCGDCEGVGHRF